MKLATFRAAALSGLDRHDLAIPLYQEATEHFESKYGRYHVTTLTTLNNYGVALIAAKRGGEAIAVFKRLLTDTEDIFDSMRPVLLRNLGHGQLVHGQLAQAEMTLQQARELSFGRGETDNVERCNQLLADCRTAQSQAE